MTRTTALPIALIVLLPTACGSEALPGPPDPVVDARGILVPPADYPRSDAAVVTESGPGTSTIVRTAEGATAELALEAQTPGNVLVYGTIIFNHPEYCVEGEDRLPEPGPCRGNGPLDPRDGSIPEVQVSADAWASLVVGADGRATFDIDLSHAVPLQRINDGPGLTEPQGAVIFVWVMDKGPAVEEGPLRAAQMNSMYGGCQGPPAMGELPCRGVAVVQHLPAE